MSKTERAVFVGSCWEHFQHTDGQIVLTKLWIYLDRGERRFAATQETALKAVCELNAVRS